MSVINQALKKAQRQQLVHSMPPPSVLSPQRTLAQRRRARVLRLGGLGCAIALLGGGAVLYGWLPTPSSPPSSKALSERISASPAALVQSPAPPKAVALSQVPPATVPALTASPVAPVAARLPHHPVAEPASAAAVALARMPTAGVGPEVAGPIPSKTAAIQPVPETGAPPASGSRPDQPPGAAPSPGGQTPPEELLQRALRQQAAGNLSQARRLFEQVVARDPTAKVAYNSLGNVYYQQEQYEQAATMYEQALAIDPDYVKARNNLGNTYMRLHMDNRALAELQQALTIDGTYSLTHYNLACFYARAGNGTAAARYLQQAIDREPQARDWAQNDKDFMRVRTTPEILSLLGGVR